MAPLNKKAKKEAAEKDLESFLFGDSNEELWSKTGHELDQPKTTKQNEEEEDDSVEETEEVSILTRTKKYVV